jgi:hypothetical protein
MDHNNVGSVLRSTTNLHSAIQHKMIGVLIYEKPLPHTATCTRTLLEHFNWELFDHRPDSPDLAQSDYHLPEELVGITAIQI